MKKIIKQKIIKSKKYKLNNKSKITSYINLQKFFRFVKSKKNIS